MASPINSENFQLHPQLANDTVTLGNTLLSQVLLMNDSQYPWVILVPMRAGISEIYQLSKVEQHLLSSESAIVGEALMRHFGGDKLNVAALGNVVPQLHIHHIVRFKDDPAWPAPVWGVLPSTPYDNPALKARSEELRTLFTSHINDFSVC